MTAAVFSSHLADSSTVPSRLSQVATRVMNALIESRARSAARELRRHEALMSDLGRRQDHSPLFLDQSDDLPFKL
ncbi:hypothetical protein VB618_12650 [Microvirga sp. CF3062]|uniref:hypothetical protein n=1 Tax=Microvirga sp. CF3062 TaxID=3110182 RepID=UPI002E77EAA8|nr:hypothetical protein [Microvirga sp. CF3062]MEE1657051.1 hypothetical protein [Microvirga sp. CF3062]